MMQDRRNVRLPATVRPGEAQHQPVWPSPSRRSVVETVAPNADEASRDVGFEQEIRGRAGPQSRRRAPERSLLVLVAGDDRGIWREAGRLPETFQRARGEAVSCIHEGDPRRAYSSKGLGRCTMHDLGGGPRLTSKGVQSSIARTVGRNHADRDRLNGRARLAEDGHLGKAVNARSASEHWLNARLEGAVTDPAAGTRAGNRAPESLLQHRGRGTVACRGCPG